MKKEKILFFIEDFVPTEAEKLEAEKLGTKMFRCARMVSKTSPIEQCDFAAGCVPEQYKHFEKESAAIEDKPKKSNKVAEASVGKAPVWKPN